MSDDLKDIRRLLNDFSVIMRDVGRIEEQLGRRPINRIERETVKLGAAIDRDYVAQQRAAQIQGVLSGRDIAPNYDTGHITAPAGTTQNWDNQSYYPPVYSPAPNDEDYGVFTFYGDGMNGHPTVNAQAYQQLLNGLFNSNLRDDGEFGDATLRESQKLAPFMRSFNPNFNPALITHEDIRILNENHLALQAFAIAQRTGVRAPDVARPIVTIGGAETDIVSKEDIAFFANDTKYRGHFILDSYGNLSFETNDGSKLHVGNSQSIEFLDNQFYLLASITGSNDVALVKSNSRGGVGDVVLRLSPEYKTSALEVEGNRFAAADVKSYDAPLHTPASTEELTVRAHT